MRLMLLGPIVLTGCGIQIGGEEWGGGKVCLQDSPVPVATSSTPAGWEEPISNLLGQATLPALGTVRPPIVGASPDFRGGGGAGWAEEGVPLSLSLQVEPSNVTRISRHPHLGSEISDCPDQVAAVVQLSMRSQLVTVETSIQLVLEPGRGVLAAAIPPEHAEVPDPPQFVRDLRHHRTWMALDATLEDGRWRGQVQWHGETDDAAGELQHEDIAPVAWLEALPN